MTKLEIKKSNQYDEPIWIIKKGSYYYLQKISNGNIIPYVKYRNLKRNRREFIRGVKRVDLVEIKLNELVQENKETELGNIYAFINDKMIDHNKNLMKELGFEFGTDKHDKIEILTSELLKSIYNYIDRVCKQVQPLDPECKLELFSR